MKLWNLRQSEAVVSYSGHSEHSEILVQLVAAGEGRAHGEAIALSLEGPVVLGGRRGD